MAPHASDKTAPFPPAVRLELGRLPSPAAVWRRLHPTQFVLPVIAPAVLLLIWELLCQRGLIRLSVLPAPSTIWLTLVDLLRSGELGNHLLISITRVLQGFVVGSTLGLALGFVIGLSKRVERSLLLITGLLRPVPIIAWVPMLILWMGIDEASKVTLIAIGSFWPVLLNVIHGIRNTDRKIIEVAQVLQKSRLSLWWNVILPSSLPAIFTGLRIGIGIAWMSVIAAELVAASAGVGYLIMYARELSQPDVMLVGVASIGITGLSIDVLIRQLERRFLRWNVNIQTN